MAHKRPPKPLVKARINTLLLACHILLILATTQDQVLAALVKANQAAHVATLFRMPDMHAKSLLYRAHCFRSLAMWSDAQHAYQLARSITACVPGDSEVARLASKCMANMAMEREEMVRQQLRRGKPVENSDVRFGTDGGKDDEAFLLQHVRDIGREKERDLLEERRLRGEDSKGQRQQLRTRVD